jgi:hypothetical protein
MRSPDWVARWSGPADGQVLWTVRDASGAERHVRTRSVDLAQLRAAVEGELPGAPARYRVETTTREHGDVYELETTTYWFVVDVAADAPVLCFQSDTLQRLGDEGQWGDVLSASGVDDVAVSGDRVIVYQGGVASCHAITTPDPDALVVWRRQRMR